MTTQQPTLREAAEKALEAIGMFQRSEECEGHFLHASEMLRAALAAEQKAEPGGERAELIRKLRTGNLTLTEAQQAAALLEEDAQRPAMRPLTDRQWYESELFKLALRKGLLTVHADYAAGEHAPATLVSWMEGHDKACDISNESAHSIKEHS